MKPLLHKAVTYALKCHVETNHKYNGQPYSVHLQKVSEIAHQYKHLVPSIDYSVVASAAWCHDVIEDTRQTYNDVKEELGIEVAEIVYALTNEKGRNRKARANDKYYEGIRDVPNAVYVKLCDRMANIEYSAETGSRMLDLYRKEHEEFVDQMFDERYSEMFEAMREILFGNAKEAH